MKSSRWKRLRLMPLLSVLMVVSVAQAQTEKDVEVATESKLAAVTLPANVYRMKAGSEPQQFRDLLKAVIDSGGPKMKQGDSEVLVWSGNDYKIGRAPQLEQAFARVLTDAGWQYQEDKKLSENGQELLPFSLVRALPQPRALIGFWVPSDQALILLWTEMLVNAPANTPASPAPAIPAPPPAPVPVNPLERLGLLPDNTAPTSGEAKVIEISGTTRQINVMKGVNPKIPTFPALTPKPGFVRGYVKDWNGKPLANAKLGVRSTAVGGAYSGSKGKTDDKGYYEFEVPFGVASFYAGAYTVDWGEGRAALSLHPADGELDGFASNVGGVENFVLLPYGISNRDKVSDSPHYSGNYYGGSFYVDYSVAEGRIFDSPGDLIAGSQIEMILTPEGTLLDGSKGQKIVIRKKVDGLNNFYVNNVPLGTYRISATVNGQPLKLRETGPYRTHEFGLEPKEANGNALLTFRPGGAQAETTVPQNGNWNSLSITLSR